MEPERPSHLVRCCLLLLGAHSIFLIIGKHDQTNEGAHAQGHLLAGEHRIAGTAKDQCQKTEMTLTDTVRRALLNLQKDPNKGDGTLNLVPPHCSQGPHPRTYRIAAFSERELR